MAYIPVYLMFWVNESDSSYEIFYDIPYFDQFSPEGQILLSEMTTFWPWNCPEFDIYVDRRSNAQFHVNEIQKMWKRVIVKIPKWYSCAYYASGIVSQRLAFHFWYCLQWWLSWDVLFSLRTAARPISIRYPQALLCRTPCPWPSMRSE